MSPSNRRSVLPRWRKLLVESLEDRKLLAIAPANFEHLTIDRRDYHPSRLLVGLRPGTDVQQFVGLIAHKGYSGEPLLGRQWELDLPAGTSVASALKALRNHPLLSYVEPDYTLRTAVVPNDARLSSQWSLNNTGQTGGTPDADIDAPEAWDLTTGISSTIVAVIDTGVDYNHPDLAANIWVNPGEIPGDGIDNEGNGFVDDIHGYDFINGDGDPRDDQGHGTHVAGTIAAMTNNGVGVAGINWNARIMALKFLGADGSGSTSDAIRALDYAVRMGAQISNNSYGDAEFSQAFRDAIENARLANHIFVAAAGNSSSNNDNAPFYPANYDVANVITVAASDHNDRLASFSSYGRTTVDLAAPGVDILSTTPNNTYTSNSGTSMASPHVAGVVSLVRGLHPSWSYQAVIDQVLNSVDYPPGLDQYTVTGGRLNAARAVGLPDLDGARIVATDPAGATAGPLGTLRVTFSEPIEPTTFTTADIASFTGPNGDIATTSVSVVAGSHNRKFEITFAPQIVKGNYQMLLGPDVLDLAGNPMNQDQDASNGEVPSDQFIASLVIGDVHVASAQDVPVSLNAFTISRSYLSLPQDLSIADLDVQVDISYPDAGMLAVTLVAPGGTRVPLSNVMGFLGPNFEGTIFDDEAATPIASGSPPFRGSYQPNSPLSALDGLSAQGTWTLEVNDGWFHSGALNAWSLSIIAHPPRLTVSDVTLAEGNSGTRDALFTVSRSHPVGEPVTVDFATVDGSATAGSDYLARSDTLTFAPGEQTKTIAVTILGDTDQEASESFYLDLTSASGGTLADARGQATIRNDEAQLTIGDVSLVEGNSGTTSAVFVASLSAASSYPISVSYVTANATAQAGSDYTSASGTLTFLPGETSKTVTVTVSGDNQNEVNETFVLNLSNPVNAELADSQAIGTISNDDPLPALSINDVKTTEGDTGVKTLIFNVTLSAASGRTISVPYEVRPGTATPGSDYTAVSGTLVFNPGQTFRTIGVAVAGDAVPESDETLVVVLDDAAGVVLLDTQGLGTIQNDDTNLSISDTSVVEGDSGIAAVTLSVSLSTAVDFDVRVNYATANGTASGGSDFVTTSGTLVFAAGQTNQTITILVLNDLLNEVSETVLVNLTSPVSTLIADAQGVATIADNDPLPSISISDPTLAEGNSGTRNLTFLIELSARSGRTITLQYETAAGTAVAGDDYVGRSGTVTFLPGSISQSIQIAINGDVAAELSESLSLVLSNPTNATLKESVGHGTILDDDNLSVTDVTLIEGNGGLQQAIVILSLATPLSEQVQLNYASANGSAGAGSDYVAVSGSVTFAPGETLQTIVVPVLGDRLDEGDETILLNLTNPVNLVLSDTQGVITISDDDDLPGLSVADATVVEGNSGTRTLAFVVTLSDASSRTISVQYATSDDSATAGRDYTARSGTLTFLPGATTQTINVTVSGDLSVEGNETLWLILSAASNAALDDDQALGTIVSDDPQPTVSINDVKLTEGQSGTKSVAFNVVLSAASAATVTVDYATQGGTATSGVDFTAAVGTLTFSPGQVNKLVFITIVGDTSPEIDETFHLTVGSVIGATILDGEGLGTIQNDDTAISIGNASVVEGHVGQADLTFAISLSAAVPFEVRVNYVTATTSAGAGSDFVAQTGTVVFQPGEITQTVTILVLGDQRDEADETLLVNLSAPVNAQFADSQGLGTIIDDDASPLVSIGDATLAEGNSGTKNLNFVISLSAASGRNVTIQYTTSNSTASAGFDYQARSGTITLFAGTLSGTISVPIIGDTLAELDEIFLLTLSNPSGATLLNSQATGTIQDDDNLSIADLAVVEGDNGVTNAVFTIALAVSLSHEVRLDYSTANGSAAAGVDYVPTSGTVVLAPGQTSQSIVVPVLGDRWNEADETILLNLLRAEGVVLSDTQAVATIADDDPLPEISISSPTIVEGNAGSRNLVFVISLSQPSGRNVSVQYTTADGSATAGSDYLARSGTLTFLPGWTSQSIAITVNGDATMESDEWLTLNLSNATNATLTGTEGVGLILDDDTTGNATLSLTESNSDPSRRGQTKAMSAWFFQPDPQSSSSAVRGTLSSLEERSWPELLPAAVDRFMSGLSISWAHKKFRLLQEQTGNDRI